MSPKFKFDFKKLFSLSSSLPKEASSMLGRFSKQLDGYEKTVRDLVKELDLKSRQARDKSAKRLDELANQVRKTRIGVEKKVVSIVNKEGKLLNKRVIGIVSYLQSLRHLDSAKKAKKTRPTKKTATLKKNPSIKKSKKTVVRAEKNVASHPSA